MFYRKRITEPLIDGCLMYGRVDVKRDQNNKLIGRDPVFYGRLFFDQCSIREQDYTYFDSTHLIHAKKVKTYYLKNALGSTKVLMDDLIYDVTRIDPDKERKYMYWYLQRTDDMYSDEVVMIG